MCDHDCPHRALPQAVRSECVCHFAHGNENLAQIFTPFHEWPFLGSIVLPGLLRLLTLDQILFALLLTFVLSVLFLSTHRFVSVVAVCRRETTSSPSLNGSLMMYMLQPKPHRIPPTAVAKELLTTCLRWPASSTHTAKQRRHKTSQCSKQLKEKQSPLPGHVLAYFHKSPEALLSTCGWWTFTIC